MPDEVNNREPVQSVLLSVVIPVFNHADLLPRALAALLAQEMAPDEIIVVDDASADDVGSAVARAGASACAGTIRVVRNETNEGVVRSLNRGLSLARGEYVYFGAADDEALPAFFAQAVARLREQPEVGLYCGEALLVDGPSGAVCGMRPAARPAMRGGFVGARDVERLLRVSDNWILTGCAVFRREAVVRAGGFDPSLGTFADGYLVRKIALMTGFYFAPRLVAKWFIFPQGQSRRTARDLAKAREVVRKIPLRLALDPTFPVWYQRIFAQRWRFAVCRLALEQATLDKALLLEMGAQTAVDHILLRGISRLPFFQIRRLLGLAFLWFRLRPYPLGAVARTVLARKSPLAQTGASLRAKT